MLSVLFVFTSVFY